MTNLRHITDHFQFEGPVISCKGYGEGYINDTFRVVCGGEGAKSYILQRINHHVFRKPWEVMENIASITDHIRHKTGYGSITPWPVRTNDREYLYGDEKLGYWRAFEFIENAVTYQKVENTEQAFFAARAFGIFCHSLAGLDTGKVHYTIPDFHNTPYRMRTFKEAIDEDPKNRLNSCREEVRSLQPFEELLNVYARLQDDLPRRVAHNDTKINNILLHKTDKEKFWVIDLDTAMPEYIMFDFGDMVRTFVSPTDEDEQDIDKITLRLPVFEALSKGFIEQVKNSLSDAEMKSLVFGAQLITYEQALRFLNDYLRGDTYYKVSYPEHNLVRTRTQIRLLELLTENEGRLKGIVG